MRLVQGILIGLLLLTAAVGMHPARAAEFSDTSGLMIEYDYRPGGPSNNDPTPLVRVYGDGRLEVAIPWYRKDAGFYEGRLSTAELEALQASLESRGVLDLDPRSVAAERAIAETQMALSPAGGSAQTDTAEIVEVIRTDHEVSRFTFSLAGSPRQKTTTWKDLRSENERFGEMVNAYADLWNAHVRLEALSDHPSLVRIRRDEIPGGYRQ